MRIAATDTRLRRRGIPRKLKPYGKQSGRSAAWLARLVRDQEVEGSNPFAPTTFPLSNLFVTQL
jgi:hypothetical protein